MSAALMLQNRPQPRTAVLTEADVVERLEQAGVCLLNLPRSRCAPSDNGTYWPEFANAAIEAYGYTAATQRAAVPTARDITLMDEAFAWVGLIPDHQKSLRRIVQMRSLVHPITGRHFWSWRRIGKVHGWHHQAVQEWHKQGIVMIVSKLRQGGRKFNFHF